MRGDAKENLQAMCDIMAQLAGNLRVSVERWNATDPVYTKIKS